MKSLMRNTSGAISKEYSELINAEIRRRIMQMAEHSAICFDACILQVMNQKHGWGKRRLRKLYEDFDEVIDELMAYFETAPISTHDGRYEVEFYAIESLKRVGVDLERWRNERSTWDPEKDEVWQNYGG